jgi:hypothetical protein
MPRQNPYQMDPLLAQGFSNLTKALIGDPETDYQVARTNRVNELLPLEKQQIQAQISGSNASAAAARAMETLRLAQTLTEEQLRDPRVQTEVAKAQAELALAAERNAGAAQTAALTPSMIAENEAQASKGLAAAFADTALGNQRNQLTPSMIAENEANASKGLAAAFADTALGNQRNQLTPSMIAENEASAQSSVAQAGNYDASAAQTAALTPSMIATNEAQAAERNSAAKLNKAKTDAEGRIILNAGQTIRTTNANGEVETYTAPETVKVEVEAGEVAVIVSPDGSQTRIEGPPGTGDPKDGTERLETIDAQLAEFFGADEFANVPKSLARRIRANITSAAKGKNIEDVSAQLQNLLSQTFNGSSVFVVRTGSNFTVPAFIANAARDDRMTAEKIVQLYGLSKDQAKRLLIDARATN